MNMYALVLGALGAGMLMLMSGYLIGTFQERTHQQTSVRNEVAERRSLAEQLVKSQGECDHWQTSNRKWRSRCLELSAQQATVSGSAASVPDGPEASGDPISVREADRRAVVARAKEETLRRNPLATMQPVAIAERDVAPPPRLTDGRDDEDGEA